ncbi:hypothetical protein VaNZ11_012103 [Volvox africanus]|uniref:Armadillo repeat-containing protein 8 n=1 Tax=Volvox africanus TaxID=51714 RepID=A0ABQ5SEQ2_9CHLO|nr:hypothetical protein VaNZ11_012103 [Volvox africanus]
MGCGASSTKGGAAAGPKPATAAQPTTEKKSNLNPVSSSGSNGTSRTASDIQKPQQQPPQCSACIGSQKAAAASPPPPAVAPKESAPPASAPGKSAPAPAVATGSRPGTPPKSADPVSKTAASPAPTDTSSRPVLQIPKLAAGTALSCLTPPPPPEPCASELSDDTLEHVRHLASGDGSTAAAAAHVRQLLCTASPPIQALLDAGAAAALVRCLKHGTSEAKLDAAWSLTNIAASPVFSHVEALYKVEAHIALLAILGVPPGQGTRSVSGSGGIGQVLAAAAAAAAAAANGGVAEGTASAGAVATAAAAAAASPALRLQALWALANIAGVIHPDYKTQTLAVEILEVGALGAVMSIMEAESTATCGREPVSASGSGSGSSANAMLRCAAWCLHNLAKHKREKEMVDVILLATQLLLNCPDLEVLTCVAWVLAYLGSNEDNKSHLKQALPALPRLVPWVREASSTLANPSLLCVGTMCTGYMRALDYSSEVVEAGGVPAFLSYLRKGNEAGRRDMVMDALFALSNVAGANNATVQALLEAGAFAEVVSLLRTVGDDEEVRMECLYVLTNAWDPLVGVEVATVQKLFESGILEELHEQLDSSAPAARLDLLLKGLTDGLKRGQMLMTYTASMMLVELGQEAAAAAPPPVNPVVELYGRLGTVKRIQALNSHPDSEVATKANGILTVLKFMS